jgi:hypothetical protein
MMATRAQGKCFRSTARGSQSGYTIFSALVGLALLLVTGGIVLESSMADYHAARSHIVYQRVNLVKSAALDYLVDTGSWPNQSQDCSNVLGRLSSDNYLIAWQRGGPQIASSCSSVDGYAMLHFTVTPENGGFLGWENALLNNMPDAHAVAGGSQVVTYLSQPVIKSQIDKHLIKRATYTTNTNNRVPKPVCKAGSSPHIYGAFSGISRSAIADPIGGEYMVIKSQTAAAWIVEGVVTSANSSGSYAPPQNRAQMMITTMCSN